MGDFKRLCNVLCGFQNLENILCKRDNIVPSVGNIVQYSVSWSLAIYCTTVNIAYIRYNILHKSNYCAIILSGYGLRQNIVQTALCNNIYRLVPLDDQYQYQYLTHKSFSPRCDTFHLDLGGFVYSTPQGLLRWTPPP